MHVTEALQTAKADFSCPHCMKDTETAGPIWIGQLFNGKFTKQMMSRSENSQMDKSCTKILATASSESELPVPYLLHA